MKSLSYARRRLVPIACCWLAAIFIGHPRLDANDHPWGQVHFAIEDLDSAHFGEREAGTRRLFDLGSVAISVLEQAALDPRREVSQRALSVLERHLSESGEPVRSEARAALERLADGDDARVGRQARRILVPQENLGPEFNGARPPLVHARRLSVRVTNRNGVEKIHVDDGEKIIELHVHPAEGVRAKVTENREDPPSISELEFDDLEALREAQPELHAIYQRHARPIGDRGGALRLPTEGFMPPLPGARGLPDAGRGEANDPLESVRRRHEEAMRRFDELHRERLERIQRWRDEVIEQLRGQGL